MSVSRYCFLQTKNIWSKKPTNKPTNKQRTFLGPKNRQNVLQCLVIVKCVSLFLQTKKDFRAKKPILSLEKQIDKKNYRYCARPCRLFESSTVTFLNANARISPPVSPPFTGQFGENHGRVAGAAPLRPLEARVRGDSPRAGRGEAGQREASP